MMGSGPYRHIQQMYWTACGTVIIFRLETGFTMSFWFWSVSRTKHWMIHLFSFLKKLEILLLGRYLTSVVSKDTTVSTLFSCTKRFKLIQKVVIRITHVIFGMNKNLMETWVSSDMHRRTDQPNPEFKQDLSYFETAMKISTPLYVYFV